MGWRARSISRHQGDGTKPRLLPKPVLFPDHLPVNRDMRWGAASQGDMKIQRMPIVIIICEKTARRHRCTCDYASSGWFTFPSVLLCLILAFLAYMKIRIQEEYPEYSKYWGIFGIKNILHYQVFKIYTYRIMLYPGAVTRGVEYLWREWLKSIMWDLQDYCSL